MRLEWILHLSCIVLFFYFLQHFMTLSPCPIDYASCSTYQMLLTSRSGSLQEANNFHVHMHSWISHMSVHSCWFFRGVGSNSGQRVRSNSVMHGQSLGKFSHGLQNKAPIGSVDAIWSGYPRDLEYPPLYNHTVHSKGTLKKSTDSHKSSHTV